MSELLLIISDIQADDKCNFLAVSITLTVLYTITFLFILRLIPKAGKRLLEQLFIFFLCMNSLTRISFFVGWSFTHPHDCPTVIQEDKSWLSYISNTPCLLFVTAFSILVYKFSYVFHRVLKSSDFHSKLSKGMIAVLILINFCMYTFGLLSLVQLTFFPDLEILQQININSMTISACLVGILFLVYGGALYISVERILREANLVHQQHLTRTVSLGHGPNYVPPQLARKKKRIRGPRLPRHPGATTGAPDSSSWQSAGSGRLSGSSQDIDHLGNVYPPYLQHEHGDKSSSGGSSSSVAPTTASSGNTAAPPRGGRGPSDGKTTGHGSTGGSLQSDPDTSDGDAKGTDGISTPGTHGYSSSGGTSSHQHPPSHGSHQGQQQHPFAVGGNGSNAFAPPGTGLGFGLGANTKPAATPSSRGSIRVKTRYNANTSQYDQNQPTAVTSSRMGFMATLPSDALTARPSGNTYGIAGNNQFSFSTSSSTPRATQASGSSTNLFTAPLHPHSAAPADVSLTKLGQVADPNSMTSTGSNSSMEEPSTPSHMVIATDPKNHLSTNRYDDHNLANQKLLNNEHELDNTDYSSKNPMKNIFRVSIVSALCLFARMTLLIVMRQFFTSQTPVIIIIYSLLSEIIPIHIMLIVFNDRSLDTSTGSHAVGPFTTTDPETVQHNYAPMDQSSQFYLGNSRFDPDGFLSPSPSSVDGQDIEDRTIIDLDPVIDRISTAHMINDTSAADLGQL